MRPRSFISRDMSSVQAVFMNSVPSTTHSSFDVFFNKTSKMASHLASPKPQ